MSISMYDVLKIINQIVSTSRDDKRPQDREKEDKIGLKREEVGESLQDRRIVDGFAVKFAGKVMRLSYTSSENIREMGEDFQEQINVTIESIMNFIKKKFKEETEQTLRVKRLMKDANVFLGVQGIMEEDVRYTGYIDYKILNITNDDADFESKFEKAARESKRKNIQEGTQKLKRIIEEKFKL